MCMHHILLEEWSKPTRDAQHCLNPPMIEVVKNKILKLLNVGIIYSIYDSKWMSLVQVVPKQSGITVVKNEENELVPTRTGWRVCIDYRKLNAATRKDHFPLPFIDQMLERLSGHSHYYFLDDYSGYNQIVIAPEDQEKTTFTCPFRTSNNLHQFFLVLRYCILRQYCQCLNCFSILVQFTVQTSTIFWLRFPTYFR